jgi:class 3 adenylate cyclase/pimeloyl-ACP methyl ester carboxylesterase
MSSVPETRYAWNGDVGLAYQIVGEGPVDLVYLQGWSSNIDLSWDSPYLASFLRGLATGARLILTDRRGWGCSDRFSPSDVPPFEVMTDDLLTVLEAVDAERPVIYASVECAPIAILFAATYPERTCGLILCDPTITYARTDDTPWMRTRAAWDAWGQDIRGAYPLDRWWQGAPEDPERAWFERYLRNAIAPGALIAEFDRFLATDVRAVLPAVSVPTLVIVDPGGEQDNDPRNGRLAAERIPDARLIETTQPDDRWFQWYGRADGIVRAVGSFLEEVRDDAGVSPATTGQGDMQERVLATVLFTDIVDSTARDATLGDRAWSEVRAAHDEAVRVNLDRFRGREVKTLGDGFLATFDGPGRAVCAAMGIVEAVRALGIEIRAGLHTGEIVSDGGDVAGLAVAIGARVAALAQPSEVLVSQTVKDLVAGSGLVFEDAGVHELKGVPDRWQLYRALVAA